MLSIKRIFNGSVLVGMALLFSQFGWAQEVLEEVKVTAQKREQSLQDVGITVNALTGDDLSELRIETAADIAKYTPNVDIKATNSFGNPNIAIRGVGLNDFSSNNTPTVGVYIDEVYLSSTSMMSFQMFDLERVEVLKGPQGTLYGRNTTAGAINFVTRKPSHEKDGYFTATAGNYGRVELEAAVGGELSDNVAGRLSVKTVQQSGGYWDSTVFGEHGDVDVFTLRGQLAWDINDDADLALMVHADRDQSDSPLWEGNGAFNASLFDPAFTGACDTVAAGNVKPNTGCTDLYGYSDANDDPFKGDWHIPAFIDRDGSGGRATLNWNIGDVTLTSITGFESLERFADDGDTVVNPDFTQFNTSVDTDVDQYSQEIRIAGSNDRVDWLVGAFYSRDEISDRVLVKSPDVFGALLGISPLDTVYDQETTAKALFVHSEWHVSDTVNLTAGLRFNDEEIEFSGTTWGTIFGTMDVLDLSPTNAEKSFEKTLWKLGLDVAVADDSMFYLSVGNGFKSGGFFGGTATSPDERLPYDPEELTAYEAGFKSRLLNNTLQLNAAIFSYDYTDIQQFLEDTVGGVQIAKLGNIRGDSSVKGLDVDLWWVPADGLDIRFGLGLLDTELATFTSEGVTYANNVLANAPDVSYTLTGRYEWDLVSGKIMSAMLSLGYSDTVFKSATNDPLFSADSYSLVDARVAVQNSDQTWELSLWVKNLTDEEYVQEAFGAPDLGTITRSYGTPQTYGVTFSHFFQ